MFDWCQIFYLCANESMKINLQITEMCWMVKKGYWSWTFLTFTQTNLLVQHIFFIKWLTLHFDPQHAFDVSVQFVIRGSLEVTVDYLAVVYFYAHLYTTLFPGKIVKSNHNRHIFFQQKKNDQQFPSFFFCQHNEKKSLHLLSLFQLFVVIWQEYLWVLFCQYMP